MSPILKSVLAGLTMLATAWLGFAIEAGASSVWEAIGLFRDSFVPLVLVLLGVIGGWLTNSPQNAHKREDSGFFGCGH